MQRQQRKAIETVIIMPKERGEGPHVHRNLDSGGKVALSPRVGC